MNENIYLEKLAEILDVNSVKMSDDVFSFENWDSLSALSLFAFLDSEYKVNLSATDIASAQTAQDIWNVVLSKSNKG